jgi:hypothetical protein
MHRSGTGLLAEIVQSLGVFLGKNQSPNRESLFFQTLNKDSLDIVGSNWRHIDLLPQPSELTEYYDWLTCFMMRRLESGLISEHFGLKVLPALVGAGFPWGWKDPRSSILLVKWLQIFPKSKVIHIFRDGRDVALSLLNRDMRREKRKAYFTDEMKCERMFEYFSLWAKYIDRIAIGCKGHRWIHEVKYESLLKKPRHEIAQLIRFCGADPGVAQEKIASIVDPSRSHRHLQKKNRWMHDIEFDQSTLKIMKYV